MDTANTTPGNWMQAELENRLDRALDGVETLLLQLSAEGMAEIGGEEGNPESHAALSETALLLLAAFIATGGTGDVAAGGGLRRRVHRLAEMMSPLARGNGILLSLALQPARALDIALPHICLTRIGYPDLRFERALHEAQWGSPRKQREESPGDCFRRVWLEWMGSVPSTEQSREQSLAATVLGRRLDLMNASREDWEAFTEAILLGRDFGCMPVNLPESADELSGKAGAALARCLDEDDFDLAAKLLAAWPLIHIPFPEGSAAGCAWSAAAAFGLEVLRRVEDQQERGRVCHGFVWSVALLPGGAPPETLPIGASSRQGAAKALTAHLPEQARQAMWWKEFQLLDEQEQDGLAGLVLQIALRRKLRTRDFSGIAQLLLEASRWGLADTPMAREAADLLNRLQVARETLESRKSQGPRAAAARAAAA
jgi:hypothetical protein